MWQFCIFSENRLETFVCAWPWKQIQIDYKLLFESFAMWNVYTLIDIKCGIKTAQIKIENYKYIMTMAIIPTKKGRFTI